jgi:putative transcription antitermination factor YqgF
VFERQQALTAGLSSAQLKRRCQAGFFERVEPRVYRMAGAPPTWHQRLFVAVLGAGAEATVSHRAAAGLWQLDGVTPRGVELSLPRGRSYDRVDVHFVTDLGPVDITTVDRLPVTNAARTLLDLGAVVDDPTLECALEGALRDDRTTVRQLRRRADALSRKGRPGLARLRRVLDRRIDGGPSESELETRFLRLLQRCKLAAPVRQHEVRVGGKLLARADFAYPRERLLIELDGWSAHGTKPAFHADRRRQNALVLAGWTLLRFTWADIGDSPAAVIAAVHARWRRRASSGTEDRPDATDRLRVRHDEGRQSAASGVRAGSPDSRGAADRGRRRGPRRRAAGRAGQGGRQGKGPELALAPGTGPGAHRRGPRRGAHHPRADMRVVGIDLGEQRVGVAVSDSEGAVASPYRVIQRSGDRARDHAEIARIVAEVGAGTVVVGLPLSLDGTEGPAAGAARAEVESLATAVDVPVETHDERLTSVSAGRSLARSGLARGARRTARRGSVDKVAAAIMLQSWLDTHVARRSPGGPDD